MQSITLRAFDGTALVADEWNPRASAALLLLTCGAETRSVWRPVVEKLSEETRKRWHIVAPDHRGHGDSGRSEQYRFDQFLRDVHGWIAKLNGKPLVIAGGSIGGALAMVAAGETTRAATTIPDWGAAIDGIVLLDVPTVPRLPRVEVERSRIKSAHANGHEAVQTIDPAFIDSGFIEDIFQDADRWRRAARRLRIPVLLLAAQRGAFGAQQLQEFKRDIPNGEVLTLPTGHLMAREDPQGVAHALERFLSMRFPLD